MQYYTVKPKISVIIRKKANQNRSREIPARCMLFAGKIYMEEGNLEQQLCHVARINRDCGRTEFAIKCCYRARSPAQTTAALAKH